MARTKAEWADLAAKVATARKAGWVAATAAQGDGGSANLDHIVLTDMLGVREATARNAGIDGYKHRDGYHLGGCSFGGQGQRRYDGVQAMHAALKASGVPCYVHYQID
jgi:hypothetical protein